MIPLYGFLQGDTLGILVFAYEDDTVETLAHRLRSAASVRVAPTSEAGRVIYQGKAVPHDLTLKQLGVEALERFDVIEDKHDS